MLGASATPALAATPPSLGTAASFAVLSAAPASGGAVSCTNGTITGDVGSTGGAASVVQTPCTIVGSIVAPVSAQVVTDFNTAYAAYAAIPCDSILTGTLASVTLTPGVYCFTAAATLTGTLTLSGSSTDTWIFKIGTGGTGALSGTGFTVAMMGGGLPCNVSWQVAQAATMTDSNFIGTILAGADLTLTRGTFVGNALATAGWTTTGTTLTGCAPAPPPGVIAISKTADAASVSAGTPIGFTVTLSNSGGSTANGVTLSDALPAGNVGNPVHWSIDGATGNPAAFSISGADGSQALSLAGQPISLAAGASLTVHLTAPTSSTSCAVYDNTASVTTSDAGSGSSPASETVLCASITVTKTADATSVNAGDPIGFTVVVANPGTGTADGVTVSDPLPAGSGAGLTWTIDVLSNAGLCSLNSVTAPQTLSCGPTTLASGLSFSVHITATTSAAECTLYDNTATATTTNDGGGTSSATITCHPANVTITKTADAAGVNAGDPIGFTVVVANPGTGTANGVTLSDPLPAGSGAGVTWTIDVQSNAGLCSLNSVTAPQTLSCGPTTLASGLSFSVHITATTSAAECTLYDNTATATTTNDGGGTGSATITCNPANVTITKTHDAASVSAGTPIGFTVTVSNTGAGTATGVTLTDALPAGNLLSPVHWSIDGTVGNPLAFSISGADGSQALSLAGQPISLLAGASLSVHVTAPTSASSCATYDNTATVTAGNEGSPTSSASETVICAANVTILKTRDAAVVDAGDPIGFTVTVNNTGAGTANGVAVDDPLPAGSGSGLSWSIDIQSNPGLCSVTGSMPNQVLSCGPTSLGPGGSFSVHITATTSAGECTIYPNTATAITTNDGGGSSSATIVCRPANVTITKTADAASVSAGSPIGFTVTLRNRGAGIARGVTVSDPLPAGSGSGLTWSIDSQTNAGLCSINSPTAPQTLNCGPTTVAGGTSFSVHITATTSAAECTIYANTATATTTNDGGGSSPATITCHLALVTVLKAADSASVSAGTPIGFTVTLSATGAGTATGIILTDALPGGNVPTPVHWSIDGSTGNPAAFSISGLDGSQTLSLAGQPISLAAGASLSVHVTAPTTALNCAAYNNTASVTTNNAGSGSSPASETVLCASITVTKLPDAATVNAGDPIGFTVVVANSGAGTATGVTVNDPLPAGSGSGLAWSIGSQSNVGLCSLNSPTPPQTLSCGPTTLANGAGFNVHITATTSAGECTLYANTATVTTTNDGSGVSSATITCNAPDPPLPGLPNTSAPDVGFGGAIPNAPLRIPDLALTILALIAGLGVVGATCARLRRHSPGFLAVGLLAIVLSLAPTSLAVGDAPSQPAAALAPGMQLIGGKAVSVVPPAKPAAEIFHTVTGPILPSRLRIPSIGVDAVVGAVGLRADGSMDVPDNLWTSSWWAGGPRPGQPGNAVIAGHRGVGSPALFSHLENVKPGDWIFVSDGAGNELIYVVTRIASLPLTNSTRKAVFESGPASRLVLITCFGDYIASARTYDHRLVVFSRPLLPIA